MIKKTKLGIAVTLAAALTASAAFAENIKIAFVDPLSGPFATTGTNGLAEWNFAADELVNKAGGVLGGKNFEIVSFDKPRSGKASLLQVIRSQSTKASALSRRATALVSLLRTQMR